MQTRQHSDISKSPQTGLMEVFGLSESAKCKLGVKKQRYRTPSSPNWGIYVTRLCYNCGRGGSETAGARGGEWLKEAVFADTDAHMNSERLWQSAQASSGSSQAGEGRGAGAPNSSQGAIGLWLLPGQKEWKESAFFNWLGRSTTPHVGPTYCSSQPAQTGLDGEGKELARKLMGGERLEEGNKYNPD